MKKMDLIIEGLKSRHVYEAYGEFGKYTRIVTKLMQAIIEAINRVDFYDRTGNVKLKFTIVKNSLSSVEDDGLIYVYLSTGKIMCDEDIIWEDRYKNYDICLFQINTKNDSIGAGRSLFSVFDPPSDIAEKCVEKVRTYTMFIKAKKI
jgi:hypothetical protein